MFENGVADLDADATLSAVEANEHIVITAEAQRLILAAHWADIHPGDAVDPEGLPGRQRAVQVGGDGTPEVADFCFASLGTALHSTAGSAARLMGDALDLRHRLLGCWAAVRTGQVPVYQARRVAYATRKLTHNQARQVDARIAFRLGRVSFGRLQALLDAFVYEADPEGADAAAAAAAQQRFVRLGQTSEHGLRLIMARVSAGDAAWIDAMVNRLAEILQLEGDTDSVDVVRSKALALYSQPAEMLRLLCTHQDDDDPDDDPGPKPAQGSKEEAEHSCPEPVEGSELSEANPDDSGRSLQLVPPPFDPAKARPRTTIYVHLSEAALSAGRGIARVEDIGPVLLTRLRHLLGDQSQIVLKPVIDLNDVPAPVDSYEIPERLREHLRLRQPVDVFPYAAGGSRSMDLDHTRRYVSPDNGGPPGQTAVGKLGPLVRYHHRVRTHGGWRVRQPEPGTWVWRSPEQRILLVNQTGTHELGRSNYAQQIWRAAKACPKPNEPHDELDSRADEILRALLDHQTVAS